MSGLGRGAVTQRVAELLESGLLIESELAVPPAGVRPANSLFVPTPDWYWWPRSVPRTSRSVSPTSRGG